MRSSSVFCLAQKQLLVLLILLCSSHSVLCQLSTPVKNPNNGHFYATLTGTYANFATAITTIGSQPNQETTKIPQLGAINSKEEWDWIYLNVANSGKYFYISSTRDSADNFNYAGTGMEGSTTFYQTATGQNMIHTNWATGHPSLLNTEPYTMVGANRFWYTVPFSNTTTPSTYLVEWREPYEIYIRPASTQGETITLQVPVGSYFTGANMTYSFTDTATGVVSFSCSGARTAAISCVIPPGTGKSTYTVVMSDGVKSHNIMYWRYQLPYVDLVYPGAANSNITLTGKNFGNDSSLITVKVSGQVCTNVVLLSAHTALQCKTPINYVGPASVVIGSNTEIVGVVQSIYDKNLMFAYRYSTTQKATQVVNYQSTTRWASAFPIDGFSRYLPNFLSSAQFNAFRGYVPTTQVGSMWLGLKSISVTTTIIDNINGPNNSMIAATSGACTAFIYCPGTFPSPTAANQFFYLDNTVGAYILDTSTVTVRSPAGMYGLKPTLTDFTVKYVNTTGGVITQAIGATTGFQYSKVSVTIGGVSIPWTKTSSSVSPTIPAGTGTGKKMVYTFESLALNGANVSYNKPFLSSFFPSTIPTSGGVITFQGYNFGADASKVTITFAGVNCPVVGTPNHYTVMCNAPAGSGINKAISITVDTQTLSNTASVSISYSPPVIASASNVGNLLSIGGSNFGTDVTKVSVLLPNQTSVVTPTTVTDNLITLTLPSSFIVNGGVAVNVDGQVSSVFNLQLDPVFQSQTTKPTTIGGSVKIRGNYLNGIRLDSTPTDVVLIVGGSNILTPITYTYDATYTYMQFDITAGTGIKNCTLSIDNQQTTFQISYALPTVTSITQSGTNFTMVGSNFGSDSNVVSVNAPVAGIFNITRVLAPHTAVLASFPANTQAGQFGLIVNTQASTTITYNPTPIIVDATLPPTNGGFIIIKGYYLLSSPVVTINGAICPINDQMTDASYVYLNCTAPSGSGTILLRVSAGSKLSDVYQYTYLAPVIDTAVSALSNVLLTGSNFGTSTNYANLTIPTLPLGTFAYISATSVQNNNAQFSVLGLNALNGPVTITVNGQISNPVTLTYSPYIISMTEVSPLGNSNVTIKGDFLNTIDSQGNNVNPSVTIGGNPCPIIDSSYDSSYTYLICTAPAGSGLLNPSIVTVAGLQSNPFGYKYLSPEINNIIQNADNSFNIIGQYFVNKNIEVSFAGQTLAGTFVNNTMITVYPSTTSSQNGQVTVKIDGLVSNIYYVYLVPSITSVESSNTVGSTITISGQFLSGNRANGTSAVVSVLINGLPATYSSSLSASYMVVTAPVGVGINLPINVTIDGMTSTTLNIFNYNPPTVTSFEQKFGMITITGTNFGNDIMSILPLVNGEVEPPIFIVTPHTQILIMAIPSLKNGILGIEVGGQSSQTIPMELTPTITAVVGTLSLTGGSLTILGRYINDKDYLGNSVPVDVSVAGQPCSNVTTTGSTLTCQYPSGLGGANITIGLQMGSKSTSALASFSSPIIQSISSTQNTTDDTVTITGVNFGTEIQQISVAVPSVSSSSVAPISFDSNTIVFKIPSDTQSGPISVNVWGQVSNPMPFVVSPVITSVLDLTTLPSFVTLTGKHFLSTRSNSTSTYVQLKFDNNNIDNGDIDIASLNTIIFQMTQEGTGKGHTITLSIDEQISTINVDYPAPTLTQVNQQVANQHYTPTITLSGSSFGSDNNNVQIVLKNQLTSVVQITSIDDDAIIATLPLFAMNDKVYVNVSNQLSNEIDLEIAPILLSITSVDSVGGEIKIGGLYLNDETSTGETLPITVTFPGNVPCSNVVKLANDQDMGYITCDAPPGSGITNNVVVQVGTLSDNINFAYGAPVISSVVASTTNLVTIVGKNFGSSQNDVTVTLGTDQTPPFTWINSTTITFNADSSMKNGLVSVKLQDGRTSNGVALYLTPIITSVSNSVKTTGDRLTITGSYLNPQRYDGSSTNITVVLDNGVCNNAQGYGSYLTCDTPQGSGTGHLIRVYIDQIPSPSYLNYSYIAPAITDVIQQGSSDEVWIVGTNLGISTSKIQVNNEITVTSFINETFIKAQLATNSKNQNIQIMVDGQPSNDIPLSIVSVVSGITSTSPYGGDIEITGRHLWTVDGNGSPVTVNILIGTDTCTSAAQMNNDGTKITCTLGSGSYNNSAVVLNIDGVQGNTTGITYTTTAPSITSVESTYYMVPGQVKLVGQEYFSPVEVTIGGEECTNVSLVDRTTVTCQFTSTITIGQDPSQPLDVYIKSGSVSTVATGKFVYRSLSCANSCSSHGQCLVSGQCKCDNGFTGSDCSISYSQSITPVGSASPASTKFTVFNATFELMITHIQEVRQDNSVVKTIPLASWTTLNESGNFILYGSIGADHSVFVNSTYFEQEATVSFAGDSIVVPSSSIKHNIIVANYQFESANSSLLVIYKFTSPIQVEINCKSEDTKYQFDTSSSSTLIKSYTIDSGVGTLMASFSNRVALDGVNSLVQSILPIESVDSSTKSSPGVQYVAIQVPAFNQRIEIDPVFSATTKIDSVQSDEDCDVVSKGNQSPTSSIVLLILFIIISILL